MTAIYTADEMTSLTSLVIGYLDNWELSAAEMLIVLGFPSHTKPRKMEQFRNGSLTLTQDSSTMQRVEHIMGITDALRTTFPFSDQMRVMWLRKPHRRFKRNTPLSVILNEGVNGLQRVRVEVDCSYGWAISEAMKNT